MLTAQTKNLLARVICIHILILYTIRLFILWWAFCLY